MRHAWTLAALLYGALIDTLCFGPKKNPRRLLPRFVIADAIARVRPFEALLRRLLFAHAQKIVVTFRTARCKSTPVESNTTLSHSGRSDAARVAKSRNPGGTDRRLNPWVPGSASGGPGMTEELWITTGRAPRTPPAPKPVPVTLYEPLPHNPFAYRDMMWPEYAPYRVIRPAHPLDGDPRSWKHVRFHVGAGDYPETGTAGFQPAPASGRAQVSRTLPAGSRRSRKGRGSSGARGVPWYKLTDAEKAARRWRRGERNVAASLRAEREERRAELAALAPPAPVWTAEDLKQISTVAIMRRLESLARVIADPAPYAKRIARKLALKPALAVRIAKRVAKRLSKTAPEVMREAEKCWDDWVPPPICADSS